MCKQHQHLSEVNCRMFCRFTVELILLSNKKSLFKPYIKALCIYHPHERDSMEEVSVK